MSRVPRATGVFLAAGTCRSPGGELALLAACRFLASLPFRSSVVIPSNLSLVDLPQGPRYRAYGMVRALLQEVMLPGAAGRGCYVGFADRLPLIGRARVSVLVAQNPHLYIPLPAHWPFLARLKTGVLRRWAKVSAGRADVIVVATPRMKEWVSVSTGVPDERIVVRSIPPQGIVDMKDRHRPRVSRIVMIGAVREYKRYAWAVQQIDEWAVRVGRWVEVVHVGEVVESRAGQEMRAAAEGCRRSSVDLRGPLRHEETLAVLVESDVLVFPSSRESYGLPLVEALACGVPIVCTDAEELRDVVGSNALFFQDRTGGLAEALAQIDEQVLRERMGQSGVERFARSEGWEIVPEGTLGLAGVGRSRER